MARDFPGSGSNYLAVGDVTAIDITGTALTVCSWINPDSVGTSLRDIIAKRNSLGAGSLILQYELRINTSSKANLIIGDGGGGSFEEVAGATSISTGAWTHLCGRKSGTGANALRVFVNGSQDGSATSNQSIGNTDKVLAFGAIVSDGVAQQFDGKIAEIGIWDAALDSDEILALARGFSPLLIRPQNLKGYWPLIGNSSPEQDLRNGNGASLTGTIPKADHPRILVPRPAIYVP